MMRRLPLCIHCLGPLARQARAIVEDATIPGRPTIGMCGGCLNAGHGGELRVDLPDDYLGVDTTWALCQLAHRSPGVVVAGPAFARLAEQVGVRRRVRCWVCGHRAQRVPRGLSGVGGERGLVLDYGPCPATELRWPCDGHLLSMDDRRRVVRAAIRHERRGGNRRSEYDL